MCFAFTSTEAALTARSYPEHDILPPAMTLLVERGSEKRTGIKSKKLVRPKPQPAQPPPPQPPAMDKVRGASGEGTGGSSSRSSRDRPGSSSSRSQRDGGRPPLLASQTMEGAESAAGSSSSSSTGAATSKAARGDSPKKGRKAKPSPKSQAKEAATLLADPRPKPTGQGKSKVKPLNLVRG